MSQLIVIDVCLSQTSTYTMASIIVIIFVIILVFDQSNHNFICLCPNDYSFYRELSFYTTV